MSDGNKPAGPGPVAVAIIVTTLLVAGTVASIRLGVGKHDAGATSDQTAHQGSPPTTCPALLRDYQMRERMLELCRRERDENYSALRECRGITGR